LFCSLNNFIALYFANHIAQTGEETFFKIKKTTKMSKVFETYAQRKGVQANSLRFMLDGERIEANQTPKMLELDDQDQIDCMLEQMGGGGL
jgi:small ubiquitin-related modifier